MKARLKRAMLMAAPPIVVELARRLRNKLAGSAEHAGWRQVEWEAVADTEAVWTANAGWAHPSIVDTQRDKWPGFIAGIASPKAFGVSHEALPGTAIDVGPHNTIMTFGYALGRAIAHRPVPSVLDWGGGLGHYFAYAQALYPSVTFDYVVKDLADICEAGKILLPEVTFIADEPKALARRYDLVFASSSLQYARDFYGVLDSICASASRYLLVTRSPFVSAHDDFVVVQRPHRYGYLTEYPCWFINRGRFIGFVEARGFRLDREFLLAERPFVPNAPEQCRYSGFLFERAA